MRKIEEIRGKINELRPGILPVPLLSMSIIRRIREGKILHRLRPHVEINLGWELDKQ